jgi:hypothetical protein
VIFGDMRKDLARSFGLGRTPLDRGDFGTWINLGRTLAKGIRRISSDDNLKPAWTLTEDVAPELFDVFTNKAFWGILDQARRIRNMTAHGGIINAHQIEAWLQELQEIQAPLRNLTGAVFDEVDLIQPGEPHVSGGVFSYQRARRLMGHESTFRTMPVRTVTPLDSDCLALVAREQGTSNVLPLLPLFRLGASPETAQNACYFFNGRTGSQVYSYVSYHFEGAPRQDFSDAELTRLIEDLSVASQEFP